VKVLLSRTDGIGDVVLTLPLAGLFKRERPGWRAEFLGQRYTRPVIERSCYVDAFHDWDALAALPRRQRLAWARRQRFDAVLHVFPRRDIASWAQAAGIPVRVGTTHRFYHFWTCNRWIALSRRRSSRHEAELNLAVAEPLLGKTRVAIDEVPSLYGLTPRAPLPSDIADLLDPRRFNLALHPLSKGPGREWPTSNFLELAKSLDVEHFQVFVTGGASERDRLEPWFPAGDPRVVNLAGRLSLDELISFLASVDGFVGAGTGPLHLAAALGRHTLGLFPPLEPIHPARWRPLGAHAQTVCVAKRCRTCRHGGECACMAAISVAEVREIVTAWPVGGAGSGLASGSRIVIVVPSPTRLLAFIEPPCFSMIP
jgi:heptosyltransferase-3